MLIPNSETDAAYIIRNAAAGSKPLAICGGGTRSGFGTVVPGMDVISSRGLCGLVDYDPAEMVMTAKAGTPLAEIEEALTANGQMLAFEPMDHRGIMGTAGIPTIGGVFAANISGPRRIIAGAARDSLLGLTFVNGKGELIRTGGRVMKNVTGLDLVKLLGGSHGTLGFITEVTFRVLPIPADQTTIVVSGLADPQAAEIMALAMGLSAQVSGAAQLPQSVKGRFIGGRLPDGEATVLRLEGGGNSVAIRTVRLTDSLKRFGPVLTLSNSDSAALWREIRDVHPYQDSGSRPIWRVSIAPSQGYKLVASLRLEAGIDAFFDWQGGLVWMRMEADAEAERLRRTILALGGGHATLIRASDAVRANTPAFNPPEAGVAALSARIKSQLDPAGIFSPGKMGW